MSTQPSPHPDLQLTQGLDVLVSQYLYEDWDFDYGSPEAAIAAFVAENPELVGSAAEGIRSLLASGSSEAERQAVLDAAGWNYDPDNSGLDAYLRVLEAALRHPAAS